jgi:G3E family GTPase
MNNHIIDIYILTGFLGSGKTTLLHRMLKEEQHRNRQVAVLMNELGNISVDSAAVPGDIPLKELLNGCICCTIQDQLTHQLLSLCQQYQPDVIYLECTGVAHPLEVLDTCISPLMTPHVRLCKIITMVDLVRWHYQRSRLSIRLQKLLEEQIRYSDFLVLNKRDELSLADQKQVVTEIAKLNPQVTTVQTNYSEFNLNLLFDLEKSSASFVHHDVTKAHVYEHLHVRTFSHEWSHPVSQAALEQWLRQSPDQLYRAKGYIRFREDPGQLYSFQYAYGMPMFRIEPFPHRAITVFIGEELDVDTLKQELKSLEQQR